MLEGKVIKNFNDGKNKDKLYETGSIFRAEDKRYNEIKAKGFLGEGKKVEDSKEKTKADK